MLFYRRLKRKIPRRFDFKADVLRRGAAAAAEHVYAELRNLLHLRCKVRRAEIIVGHSVLRVRQSRVRVHDNRKGADRAELFYNRIELQRPEAAVHAERVDPEAL